MVKLVSLTQFLLDNAVPAQYIWAVFLGMIVLAVPMMFKGRFMWGIVTAISGAGLGYYVATRYVIPYFAVSHTYNLYLTTVTVNVSAFLPAWLWILILAIAGGLILAASVRLAISGSIAYGIFYLLQTHPAAFLHPESNILGVPYMTIGIIIVAFAIGYMLYHKIEVVIAGALGVIMLYIGLAHFIPPVYAAIPVLILFPVGMYLQYTKYHAFHDPEEWRRVRNKVDRKIAKLRAQAAKAEGRVDSTLGIDVTGRKQHGPQ